VPQGAFPLHAQIRPSWLLERFRRLLDRESGSSVDSLFFSAFLFDVI
jgi:hypothetical protein